MNKLFVLIGKTSSGKDTILKNTMRYVKEHNINLSHLVSSTTRPKRVNEVDKVNYNFKTKKEFKQLYDSGLIAEYAVYKIDSINDTWFYFTTMQDLEVLNKNNVLCIKNPIGCIQLKQYLKSNLVSIMIDCPTDIRKERYISRNDNNDTFEEREKRDDECFSNFKSDYTIVNDGSKTLDELSKDIIKIIESYGD